MIVTTEIYVMSLYNTNKLEIQYIWFQCIYNI